MSDKLNNGGESLISIKGLYKNFGKLQVLKGVSTEIKKGEKVVIIGPSGSGKSTMLRCMNLLEIPTYGEIWFEGKLLTPVDPYLHPEIIRLSKTYGSMLAAAESAGESAYAPLATKSKRGRCVCGVSCKGRQIQE